MKYVGLQEQINSNNRKSILLLAAFPVLVLVMVFAFFWIINLNQEYPVPFDETVNQFLYAMPWVFAGVGIWFVIAYFGNAKMINSAAKSESLPRKENMRVYNLVENLSMSVGMQMPQLRIIESSALNAFASGINKKTFTVTLTRGIIDKLNDEELEGVIAHELTHIRNKDVKLLIVTIVFVGIFSFIMGLAMRSILYGGARRRSSNDKGGGAMILILILVLAAVAYFLSFLFKLALSRSREYLADSGAVEMTKNPLALASALEKISGNSSIEEVKSADVQQMYIDNSPNKDPNKAKFTMGLSGLFSTHPPIEKRIQALRQF